jgi:glycine/D-amino acid oxidase-like deaminating enzyme
MVIDDTGANRSSIIAAGLFNPITGKLMSRTWMADKIFPEVHRFYSWAEECLGHHFFHLQPIYRPFISIEEQNEWMGKSADHSLHEYIQEVFTKGIYSHQVHDPFGGILLRNCGYLDMRAFLGTVRNHLISKDSFTQGRFDETRLEVTSTKVRYHNIEADKIIFCNGTGIKQSNLAGWIPVRLLKGETLEIETNESLELIYNRGVYMVPMSETNRYKVGATYETKLLTPDVTEVGRLELEHKLRDLINVPFRVVNQDWGFRPTTPDRKPIIGLLPGYENVVIFNGLGTKGVSLAPYFSGHLLDWIAGKSEILPEVNINRFKSLFSKSTGGV